MTDLEFDILDELYFLVNFENLTSELGIEEKVLVNELINLVGKGWVKVYEGENELEVSELDFLHKNYKNYNYLASKSGLLAHNSR